MNTQRNRNVLFLVGSCVISITFLQCNKKDNAKPLPSKFCGSESGHTPVIKYLPYTLEHYQEDTFTVRTNDTYAMYYLYKAPSLRYVYLQHNTKVSLIHIENCSLISVPKTIRNVPNLLRLIIKSCRVRHLDLSDFVHLESLHIIDLTGNRIATILEPPVGTPALHIHRLYLANNTLRHLNVSAWGGVLDELRCLVLEGNQIHEVIPPVVLPKLEELSLRDNRISTLNCTDWHTPALQYWFCNNNRLTSVPTEWYSMWRISMFDLSFNRLESFNMDDIYLTQLDALNLGANKLTSVFTAMTHLRVPLRRLLLAQNRLQALDISHWDMPNLWMLDVNRNQLTELDDVFVRFPCLAPMLVLHNNRWSCEWLKRIHPADLRRKKYGCLKTNVTCPAAKIMVADGTWICCW